MRDEAGFEELIGAMTVEEKVAMAAGSGLWYSTPVPRLGIPSFKMSDGPNGVRGEARTAGITSTCFPVGIALGASWDPDLLNKVPADLQLLASHDLALDESMLTGESLAVTKNADAEVAADAPPAEHFDRCFAGSIVSHGRGEGVVIATGTRTEIGRIARHVARERISRPPLMIRIQRFTYQVSAAIFLAILLLAGLMVLQGGYDARTIVMMTIGLAVSTIPEGLPAALTVALAIGMRRMAQRNVIIRRLVAVEALGSTTFICSDKTGTLTVNELTVRRAVLPDGEDFAISGAGVGPGGSVEGGDTERLRELCITGVLANESYLDYAGGEWVSDGDIVDIAFLVFAKKLGLSLSGIREQQRQLKLIPYESERAWSGSLNLRGDTPCLYVKGSPEKLLSLCNRMPGPG